MGKEFILMMMTQSKTSPQMSVSLLHLSTPHTSLNTQNVPQTSLFSVKLGEFWGYFCEHLSVLLSTVEFWGKNGVCLRKRGGRGGERGEWVKRLKLRIGCFLTFAGSWTLTLESLIPAVMYKEG